MKEPDMLLVTLADKDHLDAAKQLFSSAFFYGGWESDMMLLFHSENNEKVPHDCLDWFRKKGILVKVCKPLYNKTLSLPPVVFTKYYLFKEEFRSWKKVLFLDADIIIRSSLAGFIHTTGFSAIEDIPMGKRLHKQFIKKSTDPAYRNLKKNYNLNSLCFNGGVFAFKTSIIKKNTFDDLISLTYEYESIMRQQEQSILNLYFYRSWNKLPLAYNAQGTGVYSWKKSDVDNGIILHFLHHNKPWNKDNPTYHLWRHNLEMAENIGGKSPYVMDALDSKDIDRLSWIQKKNRLLFYMKEEFFIRNLGRLGSMMKKISPGLYRFLKRDGNTSSMKKNLLVVISDRNHLNAAKQVFSGAYFNAGWKDDMMLLFHQDSKKPKHDTSLDWFRAHNIIVKRCRQIPDNYIGGFSFKMMFDTMYLFKPFFKRWNHVVYVDTDILIRAPLDDFCHSSGFSAVADWVESNRLKRQFLSNDIIKHNLKKKGLFEELKQNYRLNSRTFNAGIFSFNTDIIEDRTFNDLLSLLKKYGPVFKIRDQPLYNLYFYKRWNPLPYVYNVFYASSLPFSRKQNKGIVMHSAGPNKPWQRDNPLNAEWKRNLKKADEIGKRSTEHAETWSWLKKNYVSLLLKSDMILKYNVLELLVRRNIGKVGRILKNNWPSAYHILKRR